MMNTEQKKVVVSDRAARPPGVASLLEVSREEGVRGTCAVRPGIRGLGGSPELCTPTQPPPWQARSYPKRLFRRLPIGAPTIVIAATILTLGTFVGTAGAQKNADSLKIHESRVTGLASFVTAQGGGAIAVQPEPGKATVEPKDFLRQHGHLFGVSDPAKELVVSKVWSDRIGHTHTRYLQKYEGVPVFSGVLYVHQDAAGNIIVANGDFYPIRPGLNTKATLSSADALAVAKAKIGIANPAVEKSELVIVDPGWYGDPPIGPRLAYHIILTDPAGAVRETFFVEAHTGEILDQWNELHTAQDREVYDAEGLASIPGTLVRAEGDPQVDSPADADPAYDYSGDVYGYYDRGFGRDSIDDAGLTLVSTVNYYSAICPNAFWNGVQMTYCDGLVFDDVTAHEITHGITDYTADLIYQNESGKLNESYSDIFGELIDLFNGDAAFAGTPGGTSWPDHRTGPGLDTPNDLRTGCSSYPSYSNGVRWLLGEELDVFGGAIRDMWDPTCLGDPDKTTSALHYCGPYDEGGVHSGSGIPNHAFAMLTDGKTFNGETVTGIGPIKSAAVWYRALTTYLTPASDFGDAFEALNQAATDLIGTTPDDPRTGGASSSMFTAADADEVEDALQAVQMDLPGSTCRGACCDVFAGSCVDEVFEFQCFGDLFTPGVFCSELETPCLEPDQEARMIILLDRTGSMLQIQSDGDTRCENAQVQAQTDVIEFFDGTPGGSVAVWTFANNSVDDLTGGFVNEAAALAALAALDPEGCVGNTPLAEAICTTVDEFSEGGPGSNILAISSDGEENASTGPCDGPYSVNEPPANDYDPGSWQALVLDKVLSSFSNPVVLVRYWYTFGDTVASDEQFFIGISSATGGTYTPMPDGVPTIEPTQACCLPSSPCHDLPLEDCIVLCGTPLGPDTNCPSDCSLTCYGDVNGDGRVDPLDVGYVLSRFGCDVGTGDKECDAADTNCDGLVDPLDAGYVLARFGTCE